MVFTWQPQKRGVRLIVDGQHVKTVSKFFQTSINSESIEKLSFDKKRLSPAERQKIIDYKAYAFWLKNLDQKEKLVYELIKDSKPISRRNVVTLTDTRLEIVFENGIKVKVPDKVYYALSELEITATVRLNY